MAGNSRRSLRRVLAACFLIYAASSFAATIKPGESDLAIIIKTTDYVFADSFAQAMLTTAQFRDTIPGQPIYHLLFASNLYARMLDTEDFGGEDEFMDHINKAINALDKWVEKNPMDAWGHFFWGSAYGYKSVWQGQKGSWLKSLLSGLKSKSRFSDALKLDSTLYDCYTGIGSYHYWASIRLRKIFPFVSDNREEGLKELHIAMDSSLISTKLAGFGYAWALLNERKYSEALKVGNHLKETTMNGRSSLWLLGGIYWANGNLKKAAEYYGLLISSLDKAGEQNYYNLIYCHYRRGFCEYSLGKYQQAKADFEALLAYKPSKEIRERHSKTFSRAREYLEKINTLNPNKR